MENAGESWWDIRKDKQSGDLGGGGGIDTHQGLKYCCMPLDSLYCCNGVFCTLFASCTPEILTRAIYMQVCLV